MFFLHNFEQNSRTGRPRLGRLRELLETYFLHRADVFAALAPWGRACPAVGDWPAALRAHLAGTRVAPARLEFLQKSGTNAQSGHFRIGAYQLNLKSEVRWLCYDFDGGTEHASALADPLGAAIATMAAFSERCLPAYLERSGGGQGWHVWVFFTEPVPAAKARKLGFALAPESFLLTDGSPANPRKGHGIEVFPKQDRIGKKGFGNLVWLPWWHGAAEGGNQFYKYEARGTKDNSISPQPYFPGYFETVSEVRLDEELSLLDAACGALHDSVPTPKTTSPSPLRPHAEWRSNALARLRLEDIYGEWLTGESSTPGWLQCRDPWSSTGDRNPSAGVADGTGDAERGTFHSFISGASMSVFDFLAATGKAASFSEARKRIAELSGCRLEAAGLRNQAESSSASHPSSLQPQADRLPEIVTNRRQTSQIIRDAWNVLHSRNSMGQPIMFQRAGQIARIRRSREFGTLSIETVDDIGFMNFLVHNANWIKLTDEAKLASAPSREIARLMVDIPDDRLPTLTSIMTTPGFGAGGNLINRHGYHAADGVWFDGRGGMTCPDVSMTPSPQEVAEARSLLLDELVVDFPFATQSDKAHFLSALLLPFARRMIRGSTPLHLFEAPSVGSGKSLLCATIAAIATGAELATSSVPDQDEEFRKVITSKLMTSAPIVILDNVREKKLFDSPILAAALTSTSWVDRLLGSNKVVALPNEAAWFLTGNNPRLSMELLRRSVRIRLDPKRDRAWQRDGFKHDPLLDWVRANRTELVRACLTLIQAWIAAGKPRGKHRLGSFEDWAATMGGILQVAGVEGFLSNLDDIYENADNESEEWSAFVSAWWDEFRSEPKKVSELLELCERYDLMLGARGAGSEKSQQARLGKALSSARDRVFGRLRVEAFKDSRMKTWRYYLRAVGSPDDPTTRKPPANVDCSVSLDKSAIGERFAGGAGGAGGPGSPHAREPARPLTQARGRTREERSQSPRDPPWGPGGDMTPGMALDDQSTTEQSNLIPRKTRRAIRGHPEESMSPMC